MTSMIQGTRPADVRGGITGQVYRWRVAAYAAAAILGAGLSACIAGIPLPFTDFTMFLVEAEPYSLVDLFVERMQVGSNIRPMLWVQLKAIFELSGGSYFVAFKTYHIAHIMLTTLLCVRLLRVRMSAEFVAAIIALTVLLGIHTTINSLREGPMTIALSLALALNLIAAERSTWWKDGCAVLLLIAATLTVELGLLLWVVYVGGRLLGWRGISRAGIVAASLAVGGYLAYRFLVLGAAGMNVRGTGVGLTPREPAELSAMFGGWTVLLYAHNVGVSALTVLFSEPREGIWRVAREALAGGVRPWLWLNLVSSCLGTACLAWYAGTRMTAWRRLAFTEGDRLVLLAAAVLGANAAISFAYTRDVIMQPAGMMYALALYPALAAAFGRLPAMRVLPRAIVTVALTALAVTWSARVVGTTYVLRETAFDKRNDWATAVDVLRERGVMPTDHRQEIVWRLRRHALQFDVPVPGLAQPWAEPWTDRLY